MLSKLRPRNSDARSVKAKGRRLPSIAMLSKLRPRKIVTPSVEASSPVGTRRGDRMNYDAKLDMLKMLDRSSLDSVQGVMPSYRAIISGDKMDAVCLRDIWALIIEFRQGTGGYHVTALLPPVGHHQVILPPSDADLQLASRRVELTVQLAELQAQLVSLLRNGRITMWMELRDVVISHPFLDAVRPAFEALYFDSTTLSLNGVTCNVDRGHARLVHMLNGVHRVDMRNMGHFQPNDLDDAFIRCCLAHSCRQLVFPEGIAAPQITDESIFELFFGEDSHHRSDRLMLIEGPTLSATFVRDFVRRYLAYADDVWINLSINVTPPPQLFEEVEESSLVPDLVMVWLSQHPVEDELLEFFSLTDESELTNVYSLKPYFVRKLSMHFADQRDQKLWSAALNTGCRFVRLSNLDAYELVTERGPSDGVRLFDAAGSSIKYPRLPVAIVQVCIPFELCQSIDMLRPVQSFAEYLASLFINESDFATMCQHRPDFICDLITRRAEKQNNRFWCKKWDGDCECVFVRVSDFTENMLLTWLERHGQTWQNEHTPCMYKEIPMVVVEIKGPHCTYTSLKCANQLY